MSVTPSSSDYAALASEWATKAENQLSWLPRAKKDYPKQLAKECKRECKGLGITKDAVAVVRNRCIERCAFSSLVRWPRYPFNKCRMICEKECSRLPSGFTERCLSGCFHMLHSEVVEKTFPLYISQWKIAFLTELAIRKEQSPLANPMTLQPCEEVCSGQLGIAEGSPLGVWCRDECSRVIDNNTVLQKNFPEVFRNVAALEIAPCDRDGPSHQLITEWRLSNPKHCPIWPEDCLESQKARSREVMDSVRAIEESGILVPAIMLIAQGASSIQKYLAPGFVLWSEIYEILDIASALRAPANIVSRSQKVLLVALAALGLVRSVPLIINDPAIALAGAGIFFGIYLINNLPSRILRRSQI